MFSIHLKLIHQPTVSDQLNVLCAHYGTDITDVYHGESTIAASLISTQEQNLESEDFFLEFDDTNKKLIENVKCEAKKKLNLGQLKQVEMYEYVTANRPPSSGVYSRMCMDGCLHRYPNSMKLFKLSLLIPPTTSGVERGFSVMNLLVSPLRATLNERNVDRLMRICLDGPEKFNEDELEQLVINFKNSTTRRISL